MIELSLTIEIYIAGVKNRAGFATEQVVYIVWSKLEDLTTLH